MYICYDGRRVFLYCVIFDIILELDIILSFVKQSLFDNDLLTLHNEYQVECIH